MDKYNKSDNCFYKKLKFLQFLKEVDFVVIKNGRKCFIQVAYVMENEETIAREFSTFSPIKDESPKYILSLDAIDMSRNGITHLNIVDFLTQKNDLFLS